MNADNRSCTTTSDALAVAPLIYAKVGEDVSHEGNHRVISDPSPNASW